MKNLLLAVMTAMSVVSVPSAGAAAKKDVSAPKAPPTRREARVAFEKEWVPYFAGRKMLPAELVAKEFADISATGAVWTIALPLDDGSRLRFAKVMFKKGKFVSGTMHYMGLPEVALTADDFAELRNRFPMLAACSGKESLACLFRPREKKLRRAIVNPIQISIGPFGELYGTKFLSALGRLKVQTGDLSWRVDLTRADGVRIELGTVRNVRGRMDVPQDAILKAIGEARPELISERDRAEFYLSGELIYEPVLPGEQKEAGK